MPYVISRKGKPVLYQTDEHAFVCKGRGQEAHGYTARGAYTRWRNLVALADLCSMDVDRMKAQAAHGRRQLAAFPFMVPMAAPKAN